jgi:hypothetical protein
MSECWSCDGPCVCHQGSVCTEGCTIGRHHDGCSHGPSLSAHVETYEIDPAKGTVTRVIFTGEAES